MDKNWITYICERTAENCGDRSIVLWGKYLVSDQIASRLHTEYEKEIAFFVDTDKQKQDGQFIKAPESLSGLSDQYYVVIPIAFYESVRDAMLHYGYEKDKDYHYFCDCVIKQTEDYYEDSHGNRLIGNWQRVKFSFSGFNSIIEIEDGCELSPMVKIYVSTDSKIYIGKRCKMKEGMIKAENGSEIYIGDDVGISYNNSIVAKSGANIHIGNDVSMRHDNVIVGGENTFIYIGDDCIFSNNIEIRSHDAHSIFDICTGENINSTEEICKQRKVIIKDHVWIGTRVLVLYNTRIESGSVIGAGSLVKSYIPNNCIAAGVPAKVIRRDIAWCREDGEEDISACGEKYINYTENRM